MPKSYGSERCIHCGYLLSTNHGMNGHCMLTKNMYYATSDLIDPAQAYELVTLGLIEDTKKNLQCLASRTWTSGRVQEAIKELTECICSILNLEGNSLTIPVTKVNPEILHALERARILLRPMTIREVFALGREAIEASGLSEWCMNEGRATGDEVISLDWLNWAIKLAKDEVDE